MDTPREADAGDAVLVALEQGSPEGAALIARIIERNGQATTDLFDSLLQGEIRAHEKTKERLKAAYARLDLIELRVGWLLGGPDPLFED